MGVTSEASSAPIVSFHLQLRTPASPRAAFCWSRHCFSLSLTSDNHLYVSLSPSLSFPVHVPRAALHLLYLLAELYNNRHRSRGFPLRVLALHLLVSLAGEPGLRYEIRPQELHEAMEGTGTPSWMAAVKWAVVENGLERELAEEAVEGLEKETEGGVDEHGERVFESRELTESMCRSFAVVRMLVQPLLPKPSRKPSHLSPPCTPRRPRSPQPPPPFPDTHISHA
ncbi:hypothetical protein JCM6882_008597 [Rhodosporidiobolus microsporus]